MRTSNFITQEEALNLLGDNETIFVDGSWYLPAQNRNAKQQYALARLPGAIYFDIDAIADPYTDLPHMLPHPDVFAEVAGLMGISSDKPIVVYDGPGLFSAPRVWWTLKIMGAEDVKILEGGFDAWMKAGLPIEKGKPKQSKQGIFTSRFNAEAVASISTVEANLNSAEAMVLDARPTDRFWGKAAEPRAGLRSGHIPGSKSLPATSLVENGKLIGQKKLEQKFRDLKLRHNSPVITTCGSGVTAAIIALALSEVGHDNYKLYDGSWAEWGLPNGPEVKSS